VSSVECLWWRENNETSPRSPKHQAFFCLAPACGNLSVKIIADFPPSDSADAVRRSFVEAFSTPLGWSVAGQAPNGEVALVRSQLL
jgi:hypothetical protein